VQVHAIDASPEMVRVARNRGVEARAGDIEGIGGITGSFDGAISNFGALNCVEIVPALRAPLARLVRPGGYLAICVMGRFCLWETVHYLLAGRFRNAARRWRGHSCSATLNLEVFYPGTAGLRRALAPDFRLIRRAGIGLFVPPSYVSELAPRSLEIRSQLDRSIAHWPVARVLADHQLFIFIRQ
jgi:SAM-dependent methyltransferase